MTGQDLYGNTFWEFRDAINQNRWRRMVVSRNKASLSSLSDVQLSPQWHQWLRHTRHDAPTLQEQSADVQRQAQLKINAQLADERWAAKAKYIEKPNPAAAMKLSGDPELDRIAAENSPGQPSPEQKMANAVDSKPSQRPKVKETGTDSGAGWAPESWTPGPRKR
jgi:NADH dehydrogenase [ubiquinone] 1 alpha subcomplex assembly factor 2